MFEALKKRRQGVYRAVPVPPWLLYQLDLVHGVREAQLGRQRIATSDLAVNLFAQKLSHGTMAFRLLCNSRFVG